MVTLACLFKGKSSAWVQGVKDRLKAGKSYLRQTLRSACLKKASVLITAGYLRCLTLKIISVSMNTRNHVKAAIVVFKERPLLACHSHDNKTEGRV